MPLRIAIGTAQFGLDYGVANVQGKVPLAEARKILAYADQKGISVLDTAAAYGESETVLGNLNISNWNVITKIPGIPRDSQNVYESTLRCVAESCTRLKQNRLYGILLHNPADLLSAAGSQLYRAMQKLKSDGIVKKIGISVYAPEEIAELIAEHNFDIIQCPMSIIDRRLSESGWLERLKQMNIEVHVRSIFLQGLLLMSKQSRPGKFNRWSETWNAWDQLLESLSLTALQACVHFIKKFHEVDRIVVGIDSVSQLSEIIEAYEAVPLEISDKIRSNDPDLINPSRWKYL